VLEDARLLVSELVTNSVLHSRTEAEEWIELNVTTQEGKGLRVEVRDAGIGFEPKTLEKSEARTSHWGLFLVEKLADRWGVSNDGDTRVWFELAYDN
jgi:anti-sigma regulatory factor (Ser/Thr protein kinase)